MAHWLSGYEYRKAVTVRAARTSPVGEWVPLYLTDPTLVALVLSGADVRVTDSTGWREVYHEVLSVSATAINLVVELARPVGAAAVTLYVYAGCNSAVGSFPPTDWGPATMAAPAAKLALSWTTGLAIDPCTQSIHPNVLPVPAGSWMASDGAGGVVTHIMVDTPLPGSADEYENPSLAYSTDEGATWAEWPGVTNPIAPTPGGDGYNADPCAVINAAGNLVVFYRRLAPTTHVVTLVYRIISGTNLTDGVVVGAEQTATLPDAVLPTCPTIYKAGPALWYLFGAAGDETNVAGWPVDRWASADEGATWTGRVECIYGAGYGGRAGEKIQGYWHGGQVVALDGWYYAAWGEIYTDAGAPQHTPRLFRSRDLLAWEPARTPLLYALPTWAATNYYEPCLYLGSDAATVHMIFSATNTGSEHWVGRITLPSLATGRAITTAMALGYGRTTAAQTPATLLGLWDFAEGPGSGLTDLSGSGSNMSVEAGTPGYVAGSGYTFTEASASHLTAAGTLAGATQFEVALRLTVGALPSGPLAVIACEQGNTQRAWYVLLYSTGAVRFFVHYTDALGYEFFSTAGALAAGGTYDLLCQFQVGTQVIVFVNGVVATVSSASTPALPVYDSAARQIGVGSWRYAIGGEMRPFTGTVHRLRVSSLVPRYYVSGCATGVWTAGRERRPMNTRLVAK